MNDTNPTTSTNTHQRPDTTTDQGSSAVVHIVVRAAGQLRPRLDLTHAGTHDQQLGISVGTVLVYLRNGATAHALAQGWASAAVAARNLGPAVTGRRPVRSHPVGPVAAMIRLGGEPRVLTTSYPARTGVPAMVRIQTGPIVWEILDATAYTALLATWQRATRLLDTLHDDD